MATQSSVIDAKVAETTDTDVVEEVKETKESKLARAKGWKFFQNKHIQAGLKMIKDGKNKVLSINWKKLVFSIIIAAVASAVLYLAVNFFMWLYVAATPIFWVLVVLMVLNVIGGVLVKFGIIGGSKEDSK